MTCMKNSSETLVVRLDSCCKFFQHFRKRLVCLKSLDSHCRQQLLILTIEMCTSQD